MVVVRIGAGVLLVAHGLVHLLYLAEDVREFSLDRSWLVPDAVRRPLGLGLVAAVVVAFAVMALAVWGVPGLSAAWPTLTVVACLLSMVLLILFLGQLAGVRRRARCRRYRRRSDPASLGGASPVLAGFGVR